MKKVIKTPRERISKFHLSSVSIFRIPFFFFRKTENKRDTEISFLTLEKRVWRLSSVAENYKETLFERLTVSPHLFHFVLCRKYGTLQECGYVRMKANSGWQDTGMATNGPSDTLEIIKVFFSCFHPESRPSDDCQCQRLGQRNRVETLVEGNVETRCAFVDR